MHNGHPLMGAWQQIVGADVNGPGASAIAHGPYGDPHGALGHHHGGHRHGQASGLSPRAYLRDLPPPTMANRQVLPMTTSGTSPIPAGSSAQITSRPQRVAFRPERVFVSDTGGGAANWVINDITIGNRSQFAQAGPLPGDMFSNVAIDSFVTFETAQTAMDITMIVTYNAAEGSSVFYGAIIGTAAVH